MATKRKQPLDLAGIRAVISRAWPQVHHDSTDDEDGDMSLLRDQLITLGVNSLAKLEAIMRRHRAGALENNQWEVERQREGQSSYIDDPKRTARGVYFTLIGLTRQALKLEFGADTFLPRDAKQS